METCKCRTCQTKKVFVDDPKDPENKITVVVRDRSPARIYRYVGEWDGTPFSKYTCRTCGKVIEPQRGQHPAVKRGLRNKYHFAHEIVEEIQEESDEIRERLELGIGV